jgi:hypothetical protein
MISNNKTLLALFLTPFILFSCGLKQRKEVSERKPIKREDSLVQRIAKPQDRVINKYAQLGFDTIVSEHKIFKDNVPYKLKIIKHCLNDSAVVKFIKEYIVHDSIIPADVTYKEFEISHNYSDQIVVTNGNEIIFKKEISTDDFKEYMRVWSRFETETLYDVQYDFERANKIHFKATFIGGRQEPTREIEFGVFYQTEKVGQLDFKSNYVKYDDFNLYELNYHHDVTSKEKVGIISLSDSYRLSEHPDSIAIPDLSSVEDRKYFTLDSKYRRRFLYRTNVSETDSVFIYNYEKDAIASYKVKNLKVVACMNMYGAGNLDTQRDYMLGFEVSSSVQKKFQGALVYVGKENPFIRGQLKSIVWKKIEPTAFPSNKLSTLNALLFIVEMGAGYQRKFI